MLTTRQGCWTARKRGAGTDEKYNPDDFSEPEVSLELALWHLLIVPLPTVPLRTATPQATPACSCRHAMQRLRASPMQGAPC